MNSCRKYGKVLDKKMMINIDAGTYLKSNIEPLSTSVIRDNHGPFVFIFFTYQWFYSVLSNEYWKEQ